MTGKDVRMAKVWGEDAEGKEENLELNCGSPILMKTDGQPDTTWCEENRHTGVGGKPRRTGNQQTWENQRRKTGANRSS